MSFMWVSDKHLQFPEHKRRKRSAAAEFVMRPIAMQHQMGDEGSPEVTSSCSPMGTATGLMGAGAIPNGRNGTGDVISPAHSQGSSDIGDVAIEFWDLDLDSQTVRSGLHSVARHGSGSRGPCSDTSGSVSGTRLFYSYGAK
jgi:hypothetical protein